MNRSLPILFLAAVAVEIASIIWVGSLAGVLPTLVLMVISGMVGIRLIKSAGLRVAEAIRSPVQTKSPLGGMGSQAAMRAVSGLLFLLPGFFSDLLAVLLFLPPLQRWIVSRFRVEVFPKPAAESRRFDRVIEAEAVEITATIEPRREADT